MPQRECIAPSCPLSLSVFPGQPAAQYMGLELGSLPGPAGSACGFAQAAVTGEVASISRIVLPPWQDVLWDFSLPKHGGAPCMEIWGPLARRLELQAFLTVRLPLWCFSKCFRG